MEEVYNSVTLDPERCKGCINCIKRCPTQAIRVRNGKAHITKEFCIDCGECVRVCPHHAKKPTYDSLERIFEFKYKVALPAPSFYGQFNNLDDVNIILRALKLYGFDDVYEVAAAAEKISQLSREYIELHKDKKPFISTACPSVTKLITIRFPNLIDHLLPFVAPVELAAAYARKQAVEKTGLSPDEIGIVFISPCPAKVAAQRNPFGLKKSNIDLVVAIEKIYPKLLPLMVKTRDDAEELSQSGRIGIGWGSSGGEAGGLLVDNYLAADGIENVINVLEGLEDQKFSDLEFIELNACSGGCVGGVLQVENPYAAKAKMKRLRKYLPVSRSHVENPSDFSDVSWNQEVEYSPVFTLGENMIDSLAKMEEAQKIYARLPGLDCGSCGAPTCKALAEDVVRGIAHEKDCIHLLKEYLHRISDDLHSI